MQCVWMAISSAVMVELMVSSLRVSLLSSVVMVSLTVLEEKMNTVQRVVSLKEQ